MCFGEVPNDPKTTNLHANIEIKVLTIHMNQIPVMKIVMKKIWYISTQFFEKLLRKPSYLKLDDHSGDFR